MFGIELSPRDGLVYIKIIGIGAVIRMFLAQQYSSAAKLWTVLAHIT